MSPGHPKGIEIPPPRPKRKPYNSYPRKTDASLRSPSEEDKENSNYSKASVLLGADTLGLDTMIKKPAITSLEQQNTKQGFREGTSSTSNYLDHICSSELSQHNKPVMENLKEPRSKLAEENLTDSWLGFAAEAKSLQAARNQSHEESEGAKGNADLNLSLDSTGAAAHNRLRNSSMSSVHQELPSVLLHKGDSSSFSPSVRLINYFPSLLGTALSQNPAIHQAACVAAALLPAGYTDFSGLEAAQNQQSSVSAIVTATIAAASAWWKVQGLLPSPLQQQSAESPRAQEDISSKEIHHKRFSSERIKQQQFCSALLEPSASPDTCERPPNSAPNHAPANSKKKHDPSSCDSNTSPSCEADTYAAPNRQSNAQHNKQRLLAFQAIGLQIDLNCSGINAGSGLDGDAAGQEESNNRN